MRDVTENHYDGVQHQYPDLFYFRISFRSHFVIFFESKGVILLVSVVAVGF